MSDLIWIQTIWHSDHALKEVFKKVDFEKVSWWQQKYKKLPSMQRLLSSAEDLCKQMNQDQYQQNVNPDMDPNCLATLIVLLKRIFWMS